MVAWMRCPSRSRPSSGPALPTPTLCDVYPSGRLYGSGIAATPPPCGAYNLTPLATSASCIMETHVASGDVQWRSVPDRIGLISADVARSTGGGVRAGPLANARAKSKSMIESSTITLAHSQISRISMFCNVLSDSLRNCAPTAHSHPYAYPCNIMPGAHSAAHQARGACNHVVPHATSRVSSGASTSPTSQTQSTDGETQLRARRAPCSAPW